MNQPVNQVSNENLVTVFELQKQELDYRKQELEYRKQELSLRKQQDDHNFEYSKEALAVQSKNNELIQNTSNKMMTKLLFGIGLLFVLPACIVIVFSFIYDKTEIVLEIIKAFVYITLGAFGGFGVSKYQNK